MKKAAFNSATRSSYDSAIQTNFAKEAPRQSKHVATEPKQSASKQKQVFHSGANPGIVFEEDDGYPVTVGHA